MFINWALTNSLEGSLQRNSEELNFLSTSPSSVLCQWLDRRIQSFLATAFISCRADNMLAYLPYTGLVNSFKPIKLQLGNTVNMYFNKLFVME